MSGVLGGLIAGLGKGAPAAPTGVTATNVGTGRAYNNGAATVSFTAGAGPAATSFTATSSPGGFTATGASSPLTVTGLQSAVAYTFTVTATNAAGTSTASAASNSITATTVPQAPTIGTFTATGSGTGSITFTAGATGGSAITSFAAATNPAGGTGTGTSPITITGMTNGTSYQALVIATNANGNSTGSAFSNSIIPFDPISFDSIATLSGSGLATVTFSSIPSTYKSLQLRCYVKDSFAINPGIRFNGDTSAVYANSNQMTISSPSSVIGTSSSSTTGTSITNAILATSTASYFLPSIVDILDYASTSKNKTVTGFTGTTDNVKVAAGQWISTAAISSITIFVAAGGWSTGTTFELYGVK